MNREEFFGEFYQYSVESLEDFHGLFVSTGLNSIYFSRENAQELVEVLSRFLQENPG